MTDTPETIYLIPREQVAGTLRGIRWAVEPDPSYADDPADAVKYVRADKHQEIIDRQAKAALAGMDAAKHHALSAEQSARRLLAESNPEAIESERAANAQLTQELEQAQARVADLEAKAMQVGFDYSQAHILRKQADAAEEAIVFALRTAGNVDPFEVNMHKFANDYAQRLRDQAKEAEQAGGERGSL